jgi:fatty-acyl-CoA synthase
MTFGDLLRKAAEAAPDRLALIAGVPDPALRRQWTYAQLTREAERTARALLTRFKPGERIAVWAQNIPEWMMLEFGAGMAGMVLVTVNPAFRAREVEYVLKQSRSAGVFVVDGFRGNPMLETVQAVAPNCPELRQIICFDDWNAFIAAGDDANIKLPLVSPDDPVMIQYTSGTTGFPKGALLRHRGLVNNGADTADRMGFDPGDVFVTTMPLFHTGGCVCCVIGSVSKAATQVLVEAFDPGIVLEMFGTYRGNAMVGVPTMLIAMLEHPTFPTTDLSSVKAVCSGGSTVPAPLVKRFEEQLGAQFTIVFGQTECSPGTAAAQHGNQDRRPEQRRDGADRHDRRVLHPRLSCDARLFRDAGSDRRRHRCRWLAAYRRSLRDGRARILHDRRPPEGHDHPRRGEHLPARTGRAAIPASQGQ